MRDLYIIGIIYIPFVIVSLVILKEVIFCGVVKIRFNIGSIEYEDISFKAWVWVFLFVPYLILPILLLDLLVKLGNKLI